MLTAEQLNANPLPFAKLMGVRFVSVTKDEVVAELKVREDLCTAPMPILHGGAAMALADTAGAVATRRCGSAPTHNSWAGAPR